MVVSIGTISSAAQGVSYFERDGYYARDDPAHREVSAWAGKGAETLGLSGPVDPGIFKDVLEGTVPDGSGRRLGRPGKDGSMIHRPGRESVKPQGQRPGARQATAGRRIVRGGAHTLHSRTGRESIVRSAPA